MLCWLNQINKSINPTKLPIKLGLVIAASPSYPWRVKLYPFGETEVEIEIVPETVLETVPETVPAVLIIP